MLLKGKGHPLFFNIEIGHEVLSPLLWPYWHFLHVFVTVSLLTQQKIAFFLLFTWLVLCLVSNSEYVTEGSCITGLATSAARICG